MLKKIGLPPQSILEIWRKNFHNDTSKFIKSTFLTPSDYGREFQDSKGKTWTISGALDGSQITCINSENGWHYSWDRWEVSNILYPKNHTTWKEEATQQKVINSLIAQEVKATKKRKSKEPEVDPSSFGNFKRIEISIPQDEVSITSDESKITEEIVSSEVMETSGATA